MKLKLNTFITFLYLIISIPLFLFFKDNVFVWCSFFANYLILTFITYYHLNVEKTFSPFLSSYIIFNLLFFIFSPILQIKRIKNNTMEFVTNFPYEVSDIVFANGLIIFFNVVFFASYLYFKNSNQKSQTHKKEYNPRYVPIWVLMLLLISISVVAVNYTFIIEEINKPVFALKNQSVFSLLIKKKVLFLVPFGGIVVAYRYLKTKVLISTNSLMVFLFLFFLVIILFILKNPLIEKRNALGPIYICLIYIFTPKLIRSNTKLFTFLFLSMILFFPLISALTHIDNTFQEILETPKLVLDKFNEQGLLDTFNTLHYDAFANVMATVDYVSKNDFSFGYQLLSAFLFFIPRSIWPSKPISTGELVGNYLMDDYGFKFSNLSNPMVSEGYINFGIFGVFLMAIFLAFVIAQQLRWLYSCDALKNIIAFYFAIHLIFLMRGDFTNGFVYYVGIFFGVYVIPKGVMLLIKSALKTAR